MHRSSPLLQVMKSVIGFNRIFNSFVSLHLVIDTFSLTTFPLQKSSLILSLYPPQSRLPSEDDDSLSSPKYVGITVHMVSVYCTVHFVLSWFGLNLGNSI